MAEDLERHTQVFRTVFVCQVVGIVVCALVGTIEVGCFGGASLKGLAMVNGSCMVLLASLFGGRELVRRGAFEAGVMVTVLSASLAIAFFIAFYGVYTPVSFLCVWPILVATILMGPAAGLTIATLSALLLTILTSMELYQVLTLPLFDGDGSYSRHWHGSDDPAVIQGVIFSTITTVFVFYLAAVLSSFVSRRLVQAIGRSHQTITALKELAEHNVGVSSQLASSSQQIEDWLKKRQEGAWGQSEAVETIAENVHILLGSTREIAQRSSVVAKNAAQSLKNDDHVVEKISALSGHTKRIGEILGVMKEIANKSELLALNAALEGVKAGEKGEGFVIVASRIQTMAEDVLGSLARIQAIIDDIQTASDAVISSTQQGTALTERTAKLTQQINTITGSQKKGYEQVTLAIEDIEEVARQTVETSTEVLQAMQSLVGLSKEIRGGQDDLEGDQKPPTVETSARESTS